nr:T9SS type A sorting domain-containing protein [uncultured Chryseobacterium sp.]
MKKNLLAIGLLAIVNSVQAQVLLHVDDTAKMYVSNGTLVYNGGGLQTRGSGNIDLHGNLMIEGNNSTDVVRTITTATGAVPKLDGGNIVIRLNDLTNYASYGQLYINGFAQTSLDNAIVSKEFRAKRQGNGSYFQQIALPFSGKAVTTLSAEFGKTFTTARFSQNEILKWNNAAVVSNHYTNLATLTLDPTGYYMLGSKNNNLNTDQPPANMPTIAPTVTGSVFTLNGRPYATFAPVTLAGAGAGISFGGGGNALNQYNEKYNTYLQDNLETTAGAGAWNGNYGRNMYQFGNPFFTNLDMARIGYTEAASPGDGNAITNIWGITYDPGTIVTTSTGTTYATSPLTITFDPATNVPVGDVTISIKPMQAFLIKLRNNTSPQTLNFNTLRRFSNVSRAAGTPYSVTALKNTNTTSNYTGSVKQLGVIALDAAGNELARTYYVVSPNATTGHQADANTSVQAGNAGGSIIGTFEENPNGGYDLNYTSSYWLYINEANENNFSGKNIKLANYDFGVNNKAVSYKFEIRENAELVPASTHVLSSGTGFYFKGPNGILQEAKQDAVVPILGGEYDLYYGQPASVLNTQDVKKPSRTMVVYNPAITNYIVRFDPNWKKADIQVFDMSGKLLIAQKDVTTSRDFVIELDNALKNSYLVKIVADNGEIINAKILK